MAEIQFSLFEGDLLNTCFGRFGIGARKLSHLIYRVIIFWCLTYLPMALFAWFERLNATRPPSQNFFYDIAAYMIFFFSTPLFIVAEGIVSASLRGAAQRFEKHGVLSAEDTVKLNELHLALQHQRRRLFPDVVSIFLAFSFSYFAIYTQCFDDHETWHALGATGRQRLTSAGFWALFVAIPVANYLWLRWVWKIYLWCWYLYQISTMRLNLLATHPDRTGGIGFLSEVQSKFGILILAFGMGNVAAVTIYKLTIEGSSIEVISVWAGIAGFVLFAPSLFLIPLFFFTKQLSRCKKRSIETFEERAMERAEYFENKWLNAVKSGELTEMGSGELSGLNNLNNVFDRIKGMRVVPFDLRSIGELFAAAIGPILPLLPYLNVLPDPVVKVIDQTLKLLKGG